MPAEGFRTIDRDNIDCLYQILENEELSSDFFPASMFCFGMERNISYSRNGPAFFVRFDNYVSEDTLHSVHLLDQAGGHDQRLIRKAVAETGIYDFELVPERAAEIICDVFSADCSVQLAQTDYVYENASLVEMAGPAYRRRRRDRSSFKRNFEVYKLSTWSRLDHELQQEAFAILQAWAGSKKDARERDNAQAKFCLEHFNALRCKITLLDVDGIAVAYCVHETIHNGLAAIHFVKARPGFAGVSTLLIQEVSSYYHKRGVPLLNFEQDLGDQGLRTFKKSLNPVPGSGRKYKVSITPWQ